jgi:hypothetical protein
MYQNVFAQGLFHHLLNTLREAIRFWVTRRNHAMVNSQVQAQLVEFCLVFYTIVGRDFRKYTPKELRVVYFTVQMAGDYC